MSNVVFLIFSELDSIYNLPDENIFFVPANGDIWNVVINNTWDELVSKVRVFVNEQNQ